MFWMDSVLALGILVETVTCLSAVTVVSRILSLLRLLFYCVDVGLVRILYL